MPRVAVVGAGGFVGARLLEIASRGGDDIVAVVRSFRSVARSANLDVSHRIADAMRPETLASAFAGCDAVVNLTTGDPRQIVPTTRNVYDAAVAAGARTLVHLSSATVYGAVARPDLPDDAPPLARHWMPYAREKGRAEDLLRARMRDGRIATVVLRPGLVWGPGSPWVLGAAADLVSGSAYLVGDGGGLCNLMYVDDLVRVIRLAAAAPAAGFYHAADDEIPTWRAYYAALAAGLGVDMAGVHVVPADRYRAGVRDHLEAFRSTVAYRWLKERVALETRTALKARLRRDETAPSRGPVVTRTMWHLQTTRHRLPTRKLHETYALGAGTAFSTAVAASLAWLRFIGIDERDALASVGRTGSAIERTWRLH